VVASRHLGLLGCENAGRGWAGYVVLMAVNDGSKLLIFDQLKTADDRHSSSSLIVG
jgi:hypothetical protein